MRKIKTQKIKEKIKEKRKGSYDAQVKKISLGVLRNLTDVCLFAFYFYMQGYKVAYGKRGIGEAINKAVHLAKIANAYNLNRLIYKMKTRGYLEKKEDYWAITNLGKQRLNQVLPVYEKKRPWDGILYLITYDIPEDKRRKRDYLREYLQKLKCGLMQKSVWITCYNPKRLIADFVKEHRIVGLVLVSELKEGSGIGGKDILTVLEKVYHLNNLNREYEEFVKIVEEKKISGRQLIFTYLSILQKDPQVPFVLLPGGWWGQRAYSLFKKELKKTGKSTAN